MHNIMIVLHEVEVCPVIGIALESVLKARHTFT